MKHAQRYHEYSWNRLSLPIRIKAVLWYWLCGHYYQPKPFRNLKASVMVKWLPKSYVQKRTEAFASYVLGVDRIITVEQANEEETERNRNLEFGPVEVLGRTIGKCEDTSREYLQSLIADKNE